MNNVKILNEKDKNREITFYVKYYILSYLSKTIFYHPDGCKRLQNHFSMHLTTFSTFLASTLHVQVTWFFFHFFFNSSSLFFTLWNCPNFFLLISNNNIFSLLSKSKRMLPKQTKKTCIQPIPFLFEQTLASKKKPSRRKKLTNKAMVLR